MTVKRSPTTIIKSALRINFERAQHIASVSFDNLDLLLLSVTPIPAMITKSADARPCKSCVNDNKAVLPISGFITTVKFTIIMPSSASDRAKSKPVILSCTSGRLSQVCSWCE